MHAYLIKHFEHMLLGSFRHMEALLDRGNDVQASLLWCHRPHQASQQFRPGVGTMDVSG
jgi:hypothetical protein